MSFNLTKYAFTAFGLLIILPTLMGGASSQSSRPFDGEFRFTNEDILNLQETLSQLGYENVSNSGVVDSQTLGATKSLKRSLEAEFIRNPSGKELILNCEIEEGAPARYASTKILIDEERGIVVYHFNLEGKDLNPLRLTIDDTGAARGYFDLSMKISISTPQFLMANDIEGAFLITKRDGKFVHAFVSPFHANDGNVYAMANTHWGTCSKSPFE